MTTPPRSINADRFLADMEAQAQFGAIDGGGVNRPALSDAELAVRAWFTKQASSAGLNVRTDGAANLSAVLMTDDPNAKTLMIGSHLDSVPNGGRFDGPLGVVAALEVARTISDAGVKLPFHLEVMSFTDEEGTLVGLMGSAAASGVLQAEKLRQPRGGRDVLEAAMARVGISDDTVLSAKRRPEKLIGYIELHIEQGTRLESSGQHIGVVTALVGIGSMRLTFGGQAAHAGTTPMRERRDAFAGAADFARLALAAVAGKHAPGVMNIGDVQINPGAFNIVPAEAVLSVEYRHGSEDAMAAIREDLLGIAQDAADRYGLTLTVEELGGIAPAQMDAALMGHIEAAADTLGLSHSRMMSFAAHDPQNMAQLIPSAMFFVPSVNGISHNPVEYTAPQDCINGANVLLGAVLRVAGLT